METKVSGSFHAAAEQALAEVGGVFTSVKTDTADRMCA